MSKTQPPTYVGGYASHWSEESGKLSQGDRTNRIANLRERLLEGLVIPAHPLALTQDRKLDERHQRALTRYYLAAGAGGVAVGVHTTQFEIHHADVGLYRPVLEIAMEEVRRFSQRIAKRPVTVAGIVGMTGQALREARLARDVGCDCGLLSLGAMKEASNGQLIEHAKAVSEVIPLFGFYLQPSVGGRALGFDFWLRFSEIENVVAIKIAPFDRYRTIDVVRAVAASGRAHEIALYTGNDDNIVVDLLTEFRFADEPRGSAAFEPGREAHAPSPPIPLPRGGGEGGPTSGGPGEGNVVRPVQSLAINKLDKEGTPISGLRIVGGLLGHWAVWTQRAVELLSRIHQVRFGAEAVLAELLRLNVQITDANAALFDPQHEFAGCIPGIHEVLRRQGLLAGRWCLNPQEDLSEGQMDEIDRVYAAYPHLNDDAFVRQHLDEWLK